MSNSSNYAIIMAGGGGTRLWPMSRKEHPKQTLRLVGKRTMFQMAIDRLAGLFSPEQILVVTVADQAKILQEQVPGIPAENYLLEPMPRGTASVVGLAAIELLHRDPQASMVILTADHYIENVAYFQSLIKSGFELAQTGFLVTLGVHPTYASTGYGYIHRSELLGKYQGNPAYMVKKFIEKPDQEKARDLVIRGDHDWNSGMFIWRADSILSEFDRQMPDLFTQLNKIQSAYTDGTQRETLQKVWPDIHPQSIDYGIMENAVQVAVFPAVNLGWNDVGSWESLFDALPGDESGNIIIEAEHFGLATKDSFVISEDQRRLIVTLGLEDIIIVDTHDALLVCHRNHTQKVKDVVNYLNKNNLEKYL